MVWNILWKSRPVAHSSKDTVDYKTCSTKVSLTRFFTSGFLIKQLRAQVFLTQQYRLFSNYSASLQEIYVVLIIHKLLILLFGIGQLLFARIRYVGAPPIPPQIGIIVGFDYVEGVIGHGSQ
jgi:hypothetical protein